MACDEARRGWLGALAILWLIAGCGRFGFAPQLGDAADGARPVDTVTAFDGAPTTGLIGWWKLDESSGSTTVDSSGNGNTGTLVANPMWVAGKIGNGIKLDGSSQYVDVPDAATLRLAGSWTLSTWVSLTAIPADGEMYTLVAKTDGLGDENYSLRLDDNYGAFGTTAPGSFIAQFATTSDVDVYAVDTPPSIATNTWYLVTGVWDAAAKKVLTYVNGSLVAMANAGGSVPTTDAGQDLLLGDNAGHLDQLTDGILDDVRLYDRALSAAEIAALYASGGS